MITMNKKKIIILITLSLLLNGCNQSENSIVEHATVNVETSNDHDNGNEESTETTEQNTGTIADETTEESTDTTVSETTEESTETTEQNTATVVDETTEETTEVQLHKPVVEEVKPSHWYIRLVAEDMNRGLKSASAQLGELEESDTVSKHTLKSLSPFGGTYVDVVFKDPTGVDAGEYKTNFHIYNESSEERWQFTVKTDDANADISLTWRGLYVLAPYVDEENRQRYKEYRSLSNPLIKQMKLVDSSNGNEIAAVISDKVQVYSFNMDGQTERTFEWVVETEEVNITTQSSKLVRLQKKVVKSQDSIQKRSQTFDLTKPPMIKEDMNGK